ncbi:hypothetical protein PR048_008766 [Dryococelus australis]|uniref:Uncharacterized protein n=1 Tax=Dryococelus australis TaxID=614101 RepID=A0ABQ9HZV3_9NEOP|nr:hypothetical protein PR048_008766 [Dryococelus australis]
MPATTDPSVHHSHNFNLPSYNSSAGGDISPMPPWGKAGAPTHRPLVVPLALWSCGGGRERKRGSSCVSNRKDSCLIPGSVIGLAPFILQKAMEKPHQYHSDNIAPTSAVAFHTVTSATPTTRKLNHVMNDNLPELPDSHLQVHTCTAYAGRMLSQKTPSQIAEVSVVEEVEASSPRTEPTATEASVLRKVCGSCSEVDFADVVTSVYRGVGVISLGENSTADLSKVGSGSNCVSGLRPLPLREREFHAKEAGIAVKRDWGFRKVSPHCLVFEQSERRGIGLGARLIAVQWWGARRRPCASSSLNVLSSPHEEFSCLKEANRVRRGDSGKRAQYYVFLPHTARPGERRGELLPEAIPSIFKRILLQGLTVTHEKFPIIAGLSQGISGLTLKLGERRKIDYQYWNYLNELVDRLILLSPGNLSHTNEIISIIEEPSEAMIKYAVADELHKYGRINYPRKKYVLKGLDDTFQSDLIEMQ